MALSNIKLNHKTSIYRAIGFLPLAILVCLFVMAHPASAATLGLSPSSGAVQVGQNLAVQIKLDTGSQAIDGADVSFLNYDPTMLEVQQVLAGSLMPNTPVNTVNATAGKIRFSQVTTGGQTAPANGTLATLTFKALKIGTATLTLDFTPGFTTDSNIAQVGTDILTAVTNGSYTIGTDSCTNRPSPTTTPRPVSPPASAPTPAPTLAPEKRIYDMNNDGVLNTFDPSTYINNWKKGLCTPNMDYDSNGVCNSIDYGSLESQL